MSTITAILEPDADGSLHLPLPPELRSGQVRIIATLEPATAISQAAPPQIMQRRVEALSKLKQSDLFRDIADPVAWQRTTRDDRALPGRES